jgi:hypothetical protein
LYVVIYDHEFLMPKPFACKIAYFSPAKINAGLARFLNENNENRASAT